MNSLVVLDGEGWESGVVVLVGNRAHAVFLRNDLVLGQSVTVARYGGGKGSARVTCYEPHRIELQIEQVVPSLALRPIDLIVGLSRPQTAKKVIQAAVMSGVRSLHFVLTELGEKSYLSSHTLKPNFLQDEVVKALEQIGEGLCPQIHVHSSFRSVPWSDFESNDPSTPYLRLVASPGEPPAGQLLFEQGGRARGLALAVGPEPGWSERERDLFVKRGFTGVGLGPRVVRVEIALLFLLGQTLSVDSLIE